MRVFRKVVLPLVWVAIFSTIAVSLAAMAFDSPPKPTGSGVKPTGEIPASNTTVERGTVENTLELQGKVVVDPPASAKASHEGVINHFFVPVGAKVKKGDNLFQVKYDENGGGEDPDDENGAKPKFRYFNTVAPKDGKVTGFAKESDDMVAKGDVVASIRQSSFRATGSISPIDQYRLLDMPKTATVTIKGGPAPFECGDLSIDGSAPQSPEGEGDSADEPEPGGGSGESAGGEAVSCRVPQDVRVFDGLSMTMKIDAGTAEDVLVVPVTAVRGLVDSGTVWVTDSGEPVEREVSLGLSDGTVVEVTKGLEEGENVLEFVPGGKPESGGARGMKIQMGVAG